MVRRGLGALIAVTLGVTRLAGPAIISVIPAGAGPTTTRYSQIHVQVNRFGFQYPDGSVREYGVTVSDGHQSFPLGATAANPD